jgi:hypothetical protein
MNDCTVRKVWVVGVRPTRGSHVSVLPALGDAKGYFPTFDVALREGLAWLEGNLPKFGKDVLERDPSFAIEERYVLSAYLPAPAGWKL